MRCERPDRKPAIPDAVWTRVIESSAKVITQHLPGWADENAELIDTSMLSVLAAGSGLALFQAAGLIDGSESSGALTANVRLWSDRLKADAPEGKK